MADDNHTSEPLHAEKSTTDDVEMQEINAGEKLNDDGNESDDDEGDLECTTEIGKEMSSSRTETLAVPSCYLRAEVPEEYTLRRNESAELKSKVRGSHQEALASVIAHPAPAQVQVQDQLQSPASPPPPSSAPSQNTLENRLFSVTKSSSLSVAVTNQQNASDHISVFSSPIVRRHASDEYNWRKYGQKQVKSPQGSRSYYRCTCIQCYAKKIECCDHSNLITEVIYKGEHNHDPPTKVNRGRESEVALSVTPISAVSNTSQPVQALMDAYPSTSSEVVKQSMLLVPDLERQNSSDSDGDEFKDNEEHTDDPESIQRAKKSSSAHSGSLSKTAKKPKLVVRTPGAVGISGDGYRWRKYGQKMVKGSPHPRNYYRCTSTQCYAKKIECSDQSNLITEVIYKGEHSHDPPKELFRGRKSEVALSVTPISVLSNTSQSVQALMDAYPSTSSKVITQSMPSVPELKRHNSVDSDGDEYKDKDEHTDDFEPKQRSKKSSSPHSGSLSKTAKKPKLVVRTAGDIGISGDGYSWRKYGQKMVKGNPHPRNYYRCTSGGCGVKKIMEREVDSSTGVAITYIGAHDHETPPPKKRHDKSSRLPVAASVNIINSQSIEVKPLTSQRPMNSEGGLTGETLKVNLKKPIDSAQTLLPIGG